MSNETKTDVGTVVAHRLYQSSLPPWCWCGVKPAVGFQYVGHVDRNAPTLLANRNVLIRPLPAIGVSVSVKNAVAIDADGSPHHPSSPVALAGCAAGAVLCVAVFGFAVVVVF